MYQPKVKEVEQYSDSQGKHLVCRGILLFFGQHELSGVEGRSITKGHKVASIKPIIISETEEIEEGDKVLCVTETGYKIGNCKGSNGHKNQYHCKTDSGSGLYYFSSCHKILALPKYFSESHLKAIVDGKMEDRDEVILKCKPHDYELNRNLDKCFIYLNQQNHITLFPAKQLLEEATQEYIRKEMDRGRYDVDGVSFKDGYRKALKDHNINSSN